MRIWAERDDVYCVALDKDEYDLFIAARMAVFSDKEENPGYDPANAPEVLAKIRKNPNCYTLYFSSPHLVPFILLKKHSDGASELIGTIQLHLPKDIERSTGADITSVHILTPHRGHQYSDVLYEAALNCARQVGVGAVALHIHPKNQSSIDAAERAGFYDVGVEDPKRGKLFLKQMIIPKPNAAWRMLAAGR